MGSNEEALREVGTGAVLLLKHGRPIGPGPPAPEEARHVVAQAGCVCAIVKGILLAAPRQRMQRCESRSLHTAFWTLSSPMIDS